MSFEGCCRVTGIGSLPVSDVDEALGIVFDYAPELPYVPQLPMLSPSEGMNEQMYEGLPGLVQEGAKWVIAQDERFFLGVDKLFQEFENPDSDAGAMSSEVSHGLAPFLERVKASGVAEAKAQVSGPVTVAILLRSTAEAAAKQLAEPHRLKA